jgi:cytochrome P450
LDSPFIAIARTAVRDGKIGEHEVREGEKVVIYWASANRDEGEFPDAEMFDLDRARNRHLAFGAGPHRCAGSNIARMNIKIALDELVHRLEDVELDASSDIRYHSTFTRAPLAVPIRFTAGQVLGADGA